MGQNFCSNLRSTFQERGQASHATSTHELLKQGLTQKASRVPRKDDSYEGVQSYAEARQGLDSGVLGSLISYTVAKLSDPPSAAGLGVSAWARRHCLPAFVVAACSFRELKSLPFFCSVPF